MIYHPSPGSQYKLQFDARGSFIRSRYSFAIEFLSFFHHTKWEGKLLNSHHPYRGRRTRSSSLGRPWPLAVNPPVPRIWASFSPVRHYKLSSARVLQYSHLFALSSGETRAFFFFFLFYFIVIFAVSDKRTSPLPSGWIYFSTWKFCADNKLIE